MRFSGLLVRPVQEKDRNPFPRLPHLEKRLAKLIFARTRGAKTTLIARVAPRKFNSNLRAQLLGQALLGSEPLLAANHERIGLP
jgi:hypothetical protein